MSIRQARNEQIEQFILTHVAEHPQAVSKLTAQHFGISRSAVNKHIRRLVDEGFLRPEGQARNRTYRLTNVFQPKTSFQFDLTQKQDEDIIWRENIKPLIQDLSGNVQELWNYCTTEMINNAIDHSGGSLLEVKVSRDSAKTEIVIMDNGEGIFHKIQRELHLPDPRQALFELKKGKLTTDHTRHSGQGIFFTSRMCDDFMILSDDLVFFHNDGDERDWLTKQDGAVKGTWVFLKIVKETNRTAKSVFDQYASDDEDYQFSKTVIPVRMAAEGEALVSRSQAKRLLIRIDKFETVILDFAGVPAIGQGFADEIFRVFARQHPQIRLFPINTNEAVSNMISRALLTRTEP